MQPRTEASRSTDMAANDTRSRALDAAGRCGVFVVDYGAIYRSAAHAHPYGSLSVVLRGGFDERVGRCSKTLSPLDVVFKAPGVEHADACGGDGARTLMVVLPPSQLQELELPPWLARRSPCVAHALLPLLTTGTDRGGLVADALALLVPPSEPPLPAGRPPRWLRDVREEVDDRWSERLDVAELARRSGVHPVYLARAFRRWYGTSISDRVRMRRVTEAASLLQDRGASISEVAFRCGFSDQSHLTRVFGREFGVAPGAFRSSSVP